MALTNAQFAQACARLAQRAAQWSSDTLDIGDIEPADKAIEQ